MKIKRFLVLALATVCLLCTACSNNFAMQNIAIAGWPNTDMNSEYFNLGDFEVDFLEEGNEGDVMFRVKDNSAFVQSILDHPAIIRQEYNTKQKKVYVFGDTKNYYLLIEHIDDKKQSEYILCPAVSYYIETDGTTYQIPLFDCSIRYDGSVYFHENQDAPKTKNDWQYFLNELSRLPDDYVTIDESEKSFLLSVATDVNGKRNIDHSKKIKIVYQSDENGNYLIASLIEN